MKLSKLSREIEAELLKVDEEKFRGFSQNLKKMLDDRSAFMKFRSQFFEALKHVKDKKNDLLKQKIQTVILNFFFDKKGQLRTLKFDLSHLYFLLLAMHELNAFNNIIFLKNKTLKSFIIIKNRDFSSLYEPLCRKFQKEFSAFNECEPAFFAKFILEHGQQVFDLMADHLSLQDNQSIMAWRTSSFTGQQHRRKLAVSQISASLKFLEETQGKPEHLEKQKFVIDFLKKAYGFTQPLFDLKARNFYELIINNFTTEKDPFNAPLTKFLLQFLNVSNNNGALTEYNLTFLLEEIKRLKYPPKIHDQILQSFLYAALKADGKEGPRTKILLETMKKNKN